jgi:hypothetical protein
MSSNVLPEARNELREAVAYYEMSCRADAFFQFARQTLA